MKKLLNLIVVLLFLFHGCTPPVVFDQAYPLNGENLSNIPEIYQDIYACQSDSTIVIINEQSIVAREEHYFRTHIDKIEEREDCSIAGDELYIKHTQECVPLEYVNDTIVKGIMISWDTLFVMNEHSVARLYKGHIVISQKMEDEQWAISILSLDLENNINYRAINEKTQMNEIRKITTPQGINKDRERKPQFVIKPSMKAFDSLIKNPKIFIDCEYLERINMEANDLFIH